MIARVASLHFAPTYTAQANLLKEGFAADIVKVTGNTVIDALLSVADQVAPADIGGTGRLALVTIHRRENFW